MIWYSGSLGQKPPGHKPPDKKKPGQKPPNNKKYKLMLFVSYIFFSVSLFNCLYYDFFKEKTTLFLFWNWKVSSC
jgi:hypothetical protein